MKQQQKQNELVTYTPLTEIEAIAGQPVRGKCKDGTEVLFGQIQMSDLSAFETEVGPVGLLGAADMRVTGWSFLCLRSLQYHNHDATSKDVDALFPANATGIARMGEVVGAVLPPPEEPAAEAAEPAPATGPARSSRSARGSAGPSTT